MDQSEDNNETEIILIVFVIFFLLIFALLLILPILIAISTNSFLIYNTLKWRRTERRALHKKLFLLIMVCVLIKPCIYNNVHYYL